MWLLQHREWIASIKNGLDRLFRGLDQIDMHDPYLQVAADLAFRRLGRLASVFFSNGGAGTLSRRHNGQERDSVS